MRIAGVCALGALLAFSTSAFADTVDASGSAGDGQVPASSYTITLLGLPSNAVTDASVQFMARGDLDLDSEYISIYVEGYYFGRWLDGNTGNDSIVGPPGDNGNQYGSTVTGNSSIPLASLLPRLADGALAFTFYYSSDVGNLTTGDYLGVRVVYRTGETEPNGQVPEPALATLCAAAAGLIALRRRRRV